MILSFFKGGMPFKMHKTVFFPEKKDNLKNMCGLPYLKFSDPLLETFIFLFGLRYEPVHKILVPIAFYAASHS